MKDIELKLIKELIKNSRRSDREIAKKLNVSQPTVSRVRIRLEKEKMLNYTTIPDLPKLGFGIIAVILGKRNMQRHPENHTKEAAEFTKEHPNIIFAADGNGVGFDRVGISIHKDFSDFTRFIQEARTVWTDIMDIDSFLIDTKSKGIVQPLSFKQFAELIK